MLTIYIEIGGIGLSTNVSLTFCFILHHTLDIINIFRLDEMLGQVNSIAIYDMYMAYAAPKVCTISRQGQGTPQR